MISILHVDSEAAFRGGQESLLTLARGLRRRGHSQIIACPPSSELARRARAEGFTVAPLSLASLRERARSADVVHTHGGRAQTLAWLATLGLPVRRIASRHVAFAPRHPLVHRLKYTRTCDGIIAVSEAVRRVLVDSGVPASRVVTIHTGVELPVEFTRASRPAPGFTVGHLGAFTHEKGQSVAIEAARLIESRLPGLRMILAGDGPLRSSFAETARVTLPGRIEDKAAFFASLDVFVMPSHSEAWGLAAVEAMAHGLPVIASNTGGLAQIVEDGETGWLVPPGDAQALAGAIAQAASDRDRLAEMGRRARQRAALFSVERMVEQTEAFYGTGSRHSSSASDRRT